MIYCDTAYIAKCYLNEQGSDEVRALVRDAGRVACCAFGRLELEAPIHRNLRDGKIIPARGETNLFITPGFEFRSVGALLTNFHLPKSTLMMLVSAFATRDLILEAYRQAVAQRYRFFSYGDCMALVD